MATEDDDYDAMDMDMDDELNEDEGSASSSTSTESGDPPMSVMMVALVALTLCAIFGLKVYTFDNPIFLLNQQAVNICFLIVLSFFYGMATYRLPDTNAFRSYQTLFLPVLLIAMVWLKSYVIYSSNLYLYCGGTQDGQDEAPYRWRALLWNTSKPCIAVLVTYLFITLFPWTLTPFFELFNSAHPLVYFVGVGFWTGAATWAAEASTFFELQRTGCSPSKEIQFAEVEAEMNPMAPPTQVMDPPALGS